MVALLLVSLASLVVGIAGSAIEGSHLSRRQSSAFGYHGIDGPTNWLGLNPAANQLCSKGRNQTPINVIPGSQGLRTLTASQRPVPAYGTVRNVEFKNIGSTVEVFLGTPKLTYDGAEYTLQQFHFHTPSEHHFQREHYPLEVHFVHERTTALPDGRKPLLVYGIWMDILDDDLIDLLGPRPFQPFDSVLRRASDIPNNGQTTRIEQINFADVEQKMRNGETFTYSGSLTTPPCSEGVTWLMAREPVYIEARTYKIARNVMKFNSRFIQNRPGEINVMENACNTL